MDAGDVQQAEARVQRALSVFDALPSTDALVIFGKGNGYAVLGNIAIRRGDGDKALHYWQTAASQYEKLTGKQVVLNLVSILQRMAKLLSDRQNTEEALELMKEVDTLQTQAGASNADLAQSKSNIGVLLHRLGRELEGEEVLRKAVELSDSNEVTPQQRAEYLFHLAMTEEAARHGKSAAEHCGQALELLTPLEHTEVPRAQILLLQAMALLDDNHRGEAHQQILAAQRLVPETPGTREFRAQILMELGRTGIDGTEKGRSEALTDYQAALALVEGVDGTEEKQITCLQNIGALLDEAERRDEAIQVYRAALVKYRDHWDALTPEQSALFYSNFGHLLVKNGQTSEALDSLLLALSAEWSNAANQVSSMTQKEVQWVADQFSPRADLIYTLALLSPEKTAAQAYNALLLTKGLYSELNRMRLRRLVVSDVPSASADRNRYLELRRQLSRRTLDSDHSEVPVSPDSLTKLANEANGLERDLVRIVGPGDRNLTSPIRVEQVLLRLKSEELLIEYFTYRRIDLQTMKEKEKRYAAFVLDGTGGTVRLVDLGESHAIVAAVEDYRKCESTQADPANPALDEQQLASLGERLRQLVLDPTLPPQVHLKRIYVASADLLELIPFDALPSAKTAAGWRYLAEDMEVVHLLVGRDLARSTTTRSSSTEAWLVGDPDFEATPDERINAFNKAADRSQIEPARSSKPGSAGKPVLMGDPFSSTSSDDATIPSHWPRLEYTSSLIVSVADQATKAGLQPRVLLGAAASEEALSRMRSPRVVLFSTHGYLVKSMPPVHVTGSLNFDSSGEHMTVASRSQMFGENNSKASLVVDNEDFWETMDPLHRSMLILAGANKRVHHTIRYEVDGLLLSVEEASKRGAVTPQDEREISDGLLTGYKILGLDVDATELVILAGCESGLGITSEDKSPGIVHGGESAIGLRQALTMAGTRSVVTSMWEVPLDQTIEQTRTFLDAWLIHQRPRYQAFHESQLNALRTARSNNLGGHPFWWGGFVYFGDPGDR